jgi:hypothetical protein
MDTMFAKCRAGIDTIMYIYDMVYFVKHYE